MQKLFLKSFDQTFFKSLRVGGRVALLVLRRARKNPRRFLFGIACNAVERSGAVTSFFCACGVKRKSG